MSVYIIYPKTSVDRSQNLAPAQFNAESREEELREVVNSWRENPVYQQAESWLKNARSSKVLIYPDDLGITGTTIVEMPDDEAERMRRELPNDLIILRDRPIELIQPVQKAGARNELPQTELWHLQEINLMDEKGQRKDKLTDKDITPKNITVAVLDTGIDSTHPELQNRVIESYRMSAEGDIIISRHSPSEINSHGTHVAGLICGTSIGVAQNTKLIDCLLMPQGTGNLRDLVLWLDLLPKKRPDVDIINISGGIRNEYFPEINYLIDTLKYKMNILTVCAIGNDGFNNHMAPANCLNSLSVGATNKNRQVASFSGNATMYVNYHLYNVPYLVAPGEQIYSSVIGGRYEAWDGTSMATAIVSGIAALTLENNSQITTVNDLIQQLFNNCIYLPEEPPERQGRGLIQVP